MASDAFNRALVLVVLAAIGAATLAAPACISVAPTPPRGCAPGDCGTGGSSAGGSSPSTAGGNGPANTAGHGGD